MRANTPTSPTDLPSPKERIFRAFYAQAMRAAELAKRTGAETAKWLFYRPHPAVNAPATAGR